jgi:DDE superfamily endonuclease
VLKPWLKECWCIPPERNAEFVATMEDVLAVYVRPPDPARPLVCMDEVSKQLVKETRPGQPAQPGQPARYDAEYERAGVRNLFLAVAPLEGWRTVAVTEHRTRTDWAAFMRAVADTRYPTAERIVVLQDNLNTDGPASFYAAYPPAEARRLTERFEFHYTPKHGRWLNMAEIERSVLARQGLDRRIPDAAPLEAEVAAWVSRRNGARATSDWQFTTADARIRLQHLYPSVSP